MIERIGIVTGGGDCPGLNAVHPGRDQGRSQEGWETIGFLGGFEGILPPGATMELDYQQLGALLTRGEASWVRPTAAASRPRSATASPGASILNSSKE